MKSSKGKAPANGSSKPPKKVAQTPSNRQKFKDPVEVYSRLRPLREDEPETCTEVISNTILQITPPECSLAFKSGHRNATQHTFKRVFDENSSQREVFDTIGFPLVEDLLQGKNGLMFAYGITNSGKTYTVTGEPDQAGILPRSLDVIFNSIADVQAPKYVFRPDGTNWYEVFTEAEAKAEQYKNRPKKVSARMRSEMPEYGDVLRIPEQRKVPQGVDEDSSYAIFVSYVEIYNNYIYDLLDDTPIDPIKPKLPQSKLLREGHGRTMYVSGVTEVEVKNTEEAFETLYKGQKRRRVAQTQLNHESSRSHSVFTIRLVQAPLDPSGEEVLQDTNKMVVSQLAMVDLAGSERTSRTQSAGERLREASNINASLMVLRTCMETLRDNQLNGANKIVPYRDSKLTHVFKNYFDGEGKVRMIVCVSPKAEDYDESIHVMRFAEVTQEVVVNRPEIIKEDTGLAPGRRRANLLYKAALREAAAIKEVEEGEEGPPLASSLFTPHPYLLTLGVLSIQKYISEECDVSSLAEFKAALEHRERIRAQLIQDLKKKQTAFRLQLLAQEQEVGELRSKISELHGQKTSRDKQQRETQKLKTIISSQDEQIAGLQAELERVRGVSVTWEREASRLSERLSQLSQQKDFLMRTTEMYEADKRELEQELDVERKKKSEEKDKIRKTMQGYVSHERERFERLAQQMKQKDKALAAKNKAIVVREKALAAQDQKLRQVKELIQNSPCSARTPLRENNTAAGTPDPTRSLNVPLKSRRKRSLSENWLEHKPASTVDNGDLLQPQMKKKKTVATPKAKDLKAKQVGRYCLQHQEEDSEGDVKTALYKGEIMQTRGGGTAVQFTDVEVLRHSKPSPRKLRRSSRVAAHGGRSPTRPSHSPNFTSSSAESSMEEEWTDVETRCAVAIEGRPGSQPAFTHTKLEKPTKKK